MKHEKHCCRFKVAWKCSARTGGECAYREPCRSKLERSVGMLFSRHFWCHVQTKRELEYGTVLWLCRQEVFSGIPFIHPGISWKVLIKNEVPSSFDLTPTQRSDVNIHSMTSVYHCGIFNGDRLPPGSKERSLPRRVLLNCSLGKS